MSKTSLQAAYTALLKRNRLTPNPHQSALVTRLSTLQNDLLASPQHHNPSGPSHPKGLYIYGQVGTGKSRLADLFFSTLPSSISSRRLHFYEFMMDIHSRLHHLRSQPTFNGDPLLQIGREVRSESRVLVFDEFQVTDIADALILKRLFGAIWESGGVMVSTSNRHPSKLYENGLNRSLFLPFVAELQRWCDVWEIQGLEDYRMRKGMEEPGGRVPVFFTDAKEFERSLAEAVGEVEMQPISIPVLMSRELKVLASQPSTSSSTATSTSTSRKERLVVSTTFASLCEAFLGSADYYALSAASHTIYLSGLRKFRSDELDFVRRFIMLVDLAYEAKTRIICLSTVPLFEVFSNIVPNSAPIPVDDALKRKIEEEKLSEGEGRAERDMTVKGEGGSSSSMMSTFIGDMEWSATGLAKASLATGGAGETDVRFAIGRAVSRLFEMGSKGYGVQD